MPIGIRQCSIFEITFPEILPHYHENKQAGLIFLSHLHYETLCNHDWKTMAGLFKARCTLLAQGPAFHAAFSGHSLPIDTIERFDQNTIARRITLDIVQHKLINKTSVEVFRSIWRPNLNLGDVRRVLLVAGGRGAPARE